MIENELSTIDFLENEDIKKTILVKNEPKTYKNDFFSLKDMFYFLNIEKSVKKSEKNMFFGSKTVSSLIHELAKQIRVFFALNDNIVSIRKRFSSFNNVSDTTYTIVNKMSRQTKRALNKDFKNIQLKKSNNINKNLKKDETITPTTASSTSSASSISSTSSTTTSSFSSLLKAPKTTSIAESTTVSVIGTSFTTILSEPTIFNSPTETILPVRSKSHSHGNTYTVIGISGIVILIIIVIVALIIFGVQRSLKKQKVFEDMLYQNEMNAHAKLVAGVSTPISEKMGSTPPSSGSVLTPIIDRQYLPGRVSRFGHFYDNNKVYGSQNAVKSEEQSPDDSLGYYYNGSQSANDPSPQQYLRYPLHYNALGHSARSLSMSSRPKDYSRLRYLSHGAPVYDNSFQQDLQQPVNFSDTNEFNLEGIASNQLKSSSLGYSREMNKGYSTPTQVRSRSVDHHDTNRVFGQTNSYSSQVKPVLYSNVSSAKYANSYHIPSSSQNEPTSFDTVNTHFLNLSNTLSLPSSAYQNSTITSPEHDSSFSSDLTPPKTLLLKENTKIESPNFDLGIEKMLKFENKHTLKYNSSRTPSINASVDIWAEKKKKLLDLTSNLNKSSNNNFINPEAHINYNIARK
ncbi:hypothetical protein PCK1_002484 [Pneumocystis canis]|nr:hypothetical protein PCK1_002484 [Pneumocystis canis]